MLVGRLTTPTEPVVVVAGPVTIVASPLAVVFPSERLVYTNPLAGPHDLTILWTRVLLALFGVTFRRGSLALG